MGLAVAAVGGRGRDAAVSKPYISWLATRRLEWEKHLMFPRGSARVKRPHPTPAEGTSLGSLSPPSSFGSRRFCNRSNPEHSQS